MLRCLGVVLLTPVLALLVALSGCDKKASVNTIGLMDQAAKQSYAVAASFGLQKNFTFTGSVEDVAALQSAWDDTKATLESINLGVSKGSEALQAKPVMSAESAKQVTNTKDTVPAVAKLIKRMNTYMQPKTPEDAAALAIWKVQILDNLTVLAATVSQLDASILADMAVAVKK
jgi:hypothetical protein